MLFSLSNMTCPSTVLHIKDFIGHLPNLTFFSENAENSWSMTRSESSEYMMQVAI